MHATPSTIEMLGLVDADEEEILLGAAGLLGCAVSIVRTREEFESRATGRQTLVVGDEQTEAERLSTVRRARKRFEHCILAAIADDIAMQVELLEAGASLVVSAEDPPRKLAERIRAAEDGKCPLDPPVAGALVRRLQHLAQLCVDEGVDVARCEQLTEREREIVARLAARKSNAEIAAELGIAVGTVKTHVHNILEKLDVEHRGLAGMYWRVFDEKRGLRR